MSNSNTYSVKEVDKKNVAFYWKCIKRAFRVVFLFSMCFNTLMLLTPLYSLQVLDRVIGSQNKNTLLFLSLIIGLAYLGSYMIQVARSFTMIKVADWLDHNISPSLFDRVIITSSKSVSLRASAIVQDFRVVKNFLSSPAINAIFDAPWTFGYLVVLYMIHPYMFLIAVVGAFLIVLLAFFNVMLTKNITKEVNEKTRKSSNAMEMSSRNAQTIESMGMLSNVRSLWYKDNEDALKAQCEFAYRNQMLSNISAFIRSIIQMTVTGVGAYVVITSSVDANGPAMTTGGMIASSIFVGKALGPFNNFIGLWKTTSDAMKSYSKLKQVLDTEDEKGNAMPINIEQGAVSVERVFFSYPSIQTGKIHNTLQGISFEVNPGEVLALIGASSSGKSTMAKLLTGIWKPSIGSVRIDGNEVHNWHRDSFGKGVGYLPQEVDLFYGTVAQNIARMQTEFDPEHVIEVAKFVGAHEMISRLPGGYDYDIGIAGSKLSGGQRQRVGLARAFFGFPKILILDEPNASLDEDGELMLKQSIVHAKEMDMVVIIISHRHDILSVADKILVLDKGAMQYYGSADEFVDKMV